MNSVASAQAVSSHNNIAPYPMVSHACRVIGVSPLTVDTFEIELQSPAGLTLDYHAGQYLQLELDLKTDGQQQPLFYSIANGFDPEQPHRLQLFLQNTGEFTEQILKQLSLYCENKQSIQVTLPMGQAFLQTNLKLKHILIAAGSGISQVKCLTEEMLRQHPNVEIDIYWSNKNINDFYLFDEIKAWLIQNKNLKFTPILESAHKDWSGRAGYIYEIVQADFDNFDGVQVYLCGSPRMVYGTIDKLKVIGLKEEDCYSDVFEYAPRP